MRASTLGGNARSEETCEDGVELSDDPESWDCYVVERTPEAAEACEVSGEPLRAEYHAGLDKWIIRNAVLVTGKEAQRHGVPSRSLIHVNCLRCDAVPLFRNRRLMFGPSMVASAS